MNTKKRLLLAGAAICTVAASIAIVASHWRTQTTALLANLEQERASLRAQLRTAEERLATAEADRATRQAAVERLRRSKPSPAAPAKVPSGTAASAKSSAAARTPTSPADRRDKMMALVMADPALQVSWKKSVVPGIAREFTPLYEHLRLSPDQIARFEAAFPRRDEQLVDLAAVARTQGPDAHPAVTTLQQRAHAEFDATLQEVLGPDGWSQFREYQRLNEPRNVVRELAGLATHSGIPFGRQEADELVRALAQASPGYVRGGFAQVKRIDWSVVDAHARQVLTPAQFSLYRNLPPRLNAQIDIAIAQAQKADAASRPRGDGM